ncbi:hypothetical protein [Leekyejoonella antrihumi]|uniref:Uncharacterized protein n=1 Tax=Leekyejoonella antrihumi TaxID=1660198 RepID=A0A563DZ09_9MICO|nr:hypothetical protein [Leekyejoonella antrihumi]TWP35456.1 hypothetical protein FGL98_13875 [Leekyejoonella antrihumi]
MRITAAARTVVDLARDGSLQSAVAAADYALHHRLCDRADLESELHALDKGTAGITEVRTTIALADPRAESALESLSRVAMYELRLPRPELQVPLVDRDGQFDRGDFGWPGLVGECDGAAKYARYLRPGEAPGEVVHREKLREDRVRRSDWDVARWGWDDALSRAGLLRILSDKGLRRMPRRHWL